MHNTASLLLLVFLAITFIQSAYDKIFYWKDNVSWLKEHFSKTTLKNQVPLALAHVLILELISGILYSKVKFLSMFFENSQSSSIYKIISLSIDDVSAAKRRPE